MIEWGLEKARQAALQGANKALEEEKLDDALTAVGQIAALRKIQRATQEILREFGVPDIPLSTDQEGPVTQVNQLPSSPTSVEIIMQEGIPALIEHSPAGKNLDIVQKPHLGAELKKLGLSTRAHNVLARADHTDVEKIATMTDEELLAIRNFGVGSLHELKAKLTKRLSGIREERRLEREETKKNNKDPKFHVERIAELAEHYARALARRQGFSIQTEEPLPTGTEIFEIAIKQYLGGFGFIAFPKEDLDGFKARMIYRRGVGEISTRQGLSTAERINLYLHFLAHIALEHEDQADPPDSSVRFEGADKKSLSKTTLREEKEAEKWIRSFTEAIVARAEQKDVELADSDENW